MMDDCISSSPPTRPHLLLHLKTWRAKLGQINPTFAQPGFFFYHLCEVGWFVWFTQS